MNKLNESDFYKEGWNLHPRMGSRLMLGLGLAWFPIGLWWAKIYYKPVTSVEVAVATVITVIFGLFHLFALWALKSGFSEKRHRKKFDGDQ